MAVRLSLAETQVIQETKQYLEVEGVALDAFEQRKVRSNTILLVKNLPFNTELEEIELLFAKFGTLGRVLLPPTRTIALVEFLEQTEAKIAFQRLAYSKFKHLPLYLEWAPVETFTTKFDREQRDKLNEERKLGLVQKVTEQVQSKEPETEHDLQAVTSVFVKNVSFNTNDDALTNAFAGCSGFRTAKIATKNQRDGAKLSMGFGFIELQDKECAKKCIVAMQGTMLDGHKLDLKMSDRKKKSEDSEGSKKILKDVEVRGTKLLVRNVPFEASKKELRELFSYVITASPYRCRTISQLIFSSSNRTFGTLKSLRLPKKQNNEHRGFAFVDYLTKAETKNAYENLFSTHLYGRHLVIEWAEDDESVEALRKRTNKGMALEEGLGSNKRIVLDADTMDLQE